MSTMVHTSFRRLWVISLFACLIMGLHAEELSFRASAPSQVIAGRPFQVTYTVNQRVREMQPPEFTNFDYLAGPYTSQSSSTSFVNGKRTSTFTLTYTYTLMGNTPGTYSVAPGTIVVDGEKHASNGLKITVLPPDEGTTAPTQSQAGNARQQAATSTNASTNANDNDIFVRTLVTKTHVYEQEALQVTYRLYVAGVDFSQMTNNIKLPEFTGFLKQELDLGDRQFELEHYNGRNYQVANLFSYLLYPQHGGDITIDPARFEAIIRVATRSQVRSIFDDFFGSYSNVSKTLTAPGVTIHVRSLPAGKPAGFSGAVGRFTMDPSISTRQLKANEAITLKIDIRGTGNMKLIKTPAIDWPEGFEAYDPKVSNNFKTTASGISGTKSVEYLAIPRAAGQYTVPPVTFSYFDIESEQYRTLSSEAYTIDVLRAAGEAEATSSVQQYTAAKEDIKQLGTDIRYIDTKPLSLRPIDAADKPIFKRQWLWLWYVIPLLLTLIVFVLFRRRIRENADLTRMRYKRANKVAQKRLKQAGKLLQAQQKEAFYAEIERAAVLYLSDRLSIPTADLNKDTIADVLRSKGVDEALIKRVNDVLSTAEFARYAPSTGEEMQSLFDNTANLINDLENQKL